LCGNIAGFQSRILDFEEMKDSYSVDNSAEKAEAVNFRSGSRLGSLGAANMQHEGFC